MLERFSLAGRVAVVTGASSGIGARVAVDLAGAGATLVLAARRPDRLERVAEEIRALGGDCAAVVADVSVREDCERVAAEAAQRFGAIDVLVNNAGVASAVPALRETEEEFRAVVDLNLVGTFFMSQACASRMPRGSSIVNIASALALTTAGLPQAAYSSSKAGVLGLTRDLAQQWTGRRGIRVNAIAPGSFRTEMTGTYDESYESYLVEHRVLAGRLGEAHELSGAVLFLASDAAAYVTGVVLPVDGGLLVT
ncbi:SDR family NAD(P)-dependent oxidoreductase [Nocardioides humi]|uniref:SDR family NAD(P)-dependent oxidoreductase n=1 Tax=Nocardioides humi TaxID=449461 RepID=UPI001FECF486|nr:SDR family oxidoreductase [Nocardioides humi]